MSSRLFGVLFVLACSVAAIPAVVTDGSEVSATAEFSQDWIVVRLDRPIGEPGPDGSFLLETGFPGVDALIRDLGIWRIEHALPVSSRDPADPEAFGRWGFDRTYKFFVPSRVDIPKLVGRFARAEGVDFAEPDYRLRGSAIVPNDTLFDEQWGLENTGQSGGTPGCDVSASEAWQITTGDRVVIAVSDTGIDSNHPDFACAGKIVEGYDFADLDPDPEDTHGHGTQVSSVAAACTDNGEGIAGACWDCAVMPLRVQSPYYSSFSDAMLWAADHGARVVNNSNGGDSVSTTLLSATGYAYDAGIVHVASSGNDNTAVYFPAALIETIGVGATDANDQWPNPFCGEPGYASNFGPELDVVAPGEYIPLADMGGGYRADLCGTSYSAPLVSGLVGLIESLYPSVGQEEVKHLIRTTADDQVGRPSEDLPGFDVYHGWGRVNMERALRATEAVTTLRVDGKEATRPYFETPVEVALSYDFARGDLRALRASHMGVDVGDLTCIENDSTDADTVGNEDTETPAPGEAFFYVARFGAGPGEGSYGGSTRNRDRWVFRQRTEAASWIDGPSRGVRMGPSGAAGDVNGDGYDDVIVAAYRFGGGVEHPLSAGMAEIHLGSPSGLSPSPFWNVIGTQSYEQLGWALEGAGDVNGDGLDDVLVGSWKYDNGETDEGAAFLFFGDPTAMSMTADWATEGNQAYAEFGASLSGAGDINGDGYDDILVGAESYDGGHSNEGRIYLYLGSPSGPSSTADWTFEPDQSQAYLAAFFGPTGDLNGDGFDDVVVGAPSFDAGEVDEGIVYVFYGSASGIPTSPDETRQIDVPGAWFGGYTAGAGDVNGDGFDDLMVGAPEYTNGQPGEGAAFLYLGSADGLEPSYDWMFESDQADAELGWIARTAGDVNGDGYDDVLVGAGLYDGRRTDEGRVWLFLGSAAGLSTEPAWEMTGEQSGAQFGYWWGGGAGDINGDALDDVVVGAAYHDVFDQDEGRVYVYHGPLTETPTTDCPK